MKTRRTLRPQASGTSLISSGLNGTLPDIDRPDVQNRRCAPVARGWSRPSSDAVADATLAAWDVTPWPDALISRTCYLSTDEQRVLTYEQWSDDQPDVEDPAAIAYRLYRSGVRDDAPVPGCIVIVEVQTDGHDTARQWIDAVFDALAAEPTLHPGGISGHFHVSLDGTRVLNYAEWVDEASHVEAVSGTGSVGRGPAWRVCTRCRAWRTWVSAGLTDPAPASRLPEAQKQTPLGFIRRHCARGTDRVVGASGDAVGTPRCSWISSAVSSRFASLHAFFLNSSLSSVQTTQL